MTPTPLKIEVKNYRSCRSNEGDAFSCVMYLNGKKAASVTYDGWGGPYLFDFSVAGKDHRMMSGPLHDLFEAHVKSLGKWKSDYPGDDGHEIWLDYDFDMVLEAAITQMLEEKQLRRWCKTKVVFSVKGEKPGTYHTLLCKYEGNEARVEAQLAKHYGDSLLEIVNKRFAA